MRDEIYVFLPVNSLFYEIRYQHSYQQKRRLRASFLLVGMGERNLCTDLKIAALIEREGGTAMVPPSHIPLLCVGEGFYILGASSGKAAAWVSFLLAGMRGAQPLHRLENRCPD